MTKKGRRSRIEMMKQMVVLQELDEVAEVIEEEQSRVYARSSRLPTPDETLPAFPWWEDHTVRELEFSS